MDRIGSWGQMIKMNWPEILGYIGIIPRILTMIPVRENNEVAIKFTQISSYIIVVTNNVVWFVILIKQLSYNITYSTPIKLNSNSLSMFIPSGSPTKTSTKGNLHRTLRSRPGTLRKGVPRRLRRALRAAQRASRGTLRAVLHHRLGRVSMRKPWENHRETMEKWWKWWNMMENLDFVKKIWWLHGMYSWLILVNEIAKLMVNMQL
jgi:hypothetical protein